MNRKLLFELIDDYNLKSVRLGTESEDMTFDEINFFIDYISGTVPIHVKIGGANARNDINMLLSMGIRGIICPMVESPFGLKIFIQALRELSGNTYYALKKGINIETITAYHNLGEIIQTPLFKELDEVNLARHNFSQSIERDTDDPTVYSMMSIMASRLRRFTKTLVVSGGVHPENSVEILKRVAPDHINTGLFVLGAKNTVRIWEGVHKALSLEKIVYEEMRRIFRKRSELFDSVLDQINQRLHQEPHNFTSESICEKSYILQ
jgi:phosphoribosylformimino-5-aminoimidazole carboxamide ribonucleotide (ProFAR) isomerase